MVYRLSSWQETAAAKRQAISNAIPEHWRIPSSLIPTAEEQPDVTSSYIHQYLTPREIEITEADAVKITQHTTVGLWSALEITQAFCHRAAIAHQLINCLHEIFFDEAIAAANALDAYFAENQRPLGPLHGLPVSLKDQFHVKGVETTMGYVSWIGTFEGTRIDPRARTFESELVRELRALGAVLFCKTSVPTSLMAAETANNIIGYTQNPKNRYLSCGGSSGGEGALLALRGSPAGFGTDIGGSIRVPASFNGIFGLRPSGGRLPYEGAANSLDGQNTILSVVGPMATSLRSLTLLFKAILQQEPWYRDPLVLELPWRDAVVRDFEVSVAPKSTFAIIRHDGAVEPHPPVKRALLMVENLLKQRGHRVTEWKPPSHADAYKIAVEAFHQDGGEDVQAHLAQSGEYQPPQVFLEKGEHLNARQVAALNMRKRVYQKLYMDYWNSNPVDALICPTAPSAAVAPGYFRYSGYTAFVNVLDYSSVVIPITHADRVIDLPQSRDRFLTEMDRTVHSDYDPDIYRGAPVGCQIVCRRLEEEKVLSLAEYISHVLENHQ